MQHTTLSTGQVAELKGTTEPAINDLIRRRLFTPIPPVVAGRRQWQPEHVQALSDYLEARHAR